jgi:Flp pilus assembly CpaE family ATPase
MTIYLLSAEGERGEADRVERRLRTALPDLLRIGSIEEIIDVAPHAGAPAYVLFVAPAQGRGYFRTLLDMAGRHRHRLSFILLSGEISVDDYKALVRTGGDWVSLGADPKEIHDIMARQEARGRYETGGTGPGARKPLAVALVPSAGGVGNATIAVETAAYLKTAKSTRSRDVCIVDLDFQSSHVCDHLDIEPRLQIAEISRNPERLDAQLFEIFVSRHASGLHVFAAPRGKFDCCELNVAALDAFFNLVSARYDLILIDLPPTWFAWTDAIVSACDGVLVTGLNTIPGLRRMVDTVGAVRAAANVSAQVAVIANRCQRRLVGGIARRQHVESVLGGERLFYLGEERDALESINTGVPLVLSKSRRHAFVKEIATIAGFCAELKSSRVTQDAAGGSLAIAR